MFFPSILQNTLLGRNAEEIYMVDEFTNLYNGTSSELHQQNSNSFGEEPFQNFDYFFNESTEEYSCNTCSFKSIYKHSITRHLRTHSGIRPFKCVFCNFTCSHSNTIKEHIRIHTGEKPYSCRFCDKKFRHKNSCQYHEDRHTRVGSFNWS